MIAPRLVFTSEEVWLARFPMERGSVHLTDFPEASKEWSNSVIEEKWDFIREVRRVVSGAIELSRQDKLIGASLEAHPHIYVDSEEKISLLKDVDLAELCISSKCYSSEW